jgi:hypothetical protein
MDERVKFLIAVFGLMLFAISPVFVGVSTYNTAWENPEEPMLDDTVSYRRKVSIAPCPNKRVWM